MEKVRGKGSTGTRGFLPGRTIGGLSEAGKGWQENGAAFVLCYNCFRHRTLKGPRETPLPFSPITEIPEQHQMRGQ